MKKRLLGKKQPSILALFALQTACCCSGQTLENWEIHMRENDWAFDGNGWQLDAPDAGDSWICFCPLDSLSDAEGRSLLFHWSQPFSGSSQNFSRTHLIQRPNSAWNWESQAPFPVSAWVVNPVIAELDIGHFLHLGESGSLDSMRWMQTNSNEPPMEIASAASPAPAGEIEHWIRWNQSTDSVSIDFSAHSTPFEWHHAMEGNANNQPDCIGFSAKFTASHAADFRIEIGHIKEHEPDTTPPFMVRSLWLSDQVLALHFNEPLSPHSGVGKWAQGDSLFFAPEMHKSNRRIGLCAGDFPEGQPQILTIHGLLDASGNELSNPINQVLRTSSQDMKPHSMQFTEIMFDPNPSLGFPEAEWIEILNRSESFHAIADFVVLDGSSETQVALSPEFGWDGILAPGERAIVAGCDFRINGDSVHQAKGIPWPGLNNAGESLMLLGEDGSIADALHFTEEWMQESNNGGVSLQITDWNACNSRSNWGPSMHPLGSTPGMVSYQEGPNLSSQHPLTLSEITPTSSSEGILAFNQPLDPLSELIMIGIQAGNLNHLTGNDSTIAWKLHSLPATKKIVFYAHGIEACVQSERSSSKWFIQLKTHRFPEFQDLLITEIAHQPMGATEAWGSFVEVTNVHPSDSLELGGLTCNNSPLSGRIVLAPGARHCFPEINLPNTSGGVSIRAADGTLIDEVIYSNCWHRQRMNEDNGKSLVRLNLEKGAHGSFNWSSSMDSRGCSPGTSDPAEEQLTLHRLPLPVTCGVFHNRWAILFNGPVEIASDDWDPVFREECGSWAGSLEANQLWAGPSQFEPLEGGIAEMTWGDGATTIASLCPSSSFVLEDVACDFTLNEIQQLKLNGPEPFIEIVHSEHPWISTRLLQWTTTTSPNPSDWIFVSPEVQWFISQNTPTAFSRCPSRWFSQGARVIPADLPSLWGNRELQLARSGAFLDSIHLHPNHDSPWSTWHHLRSLERVDGFNLPLSDCSSPPQTWKSSLDKRGATPGESNSWSRTQWASLDSHEALNVINDTWRASSDAIIQPIRVLLRAPAEGAWQAQLSIANASGVQLANITDDTIWLSIGESQEVAWDGFVQGRVPPPGTYWVVGHFIHHETGIRRTFFHPVHIMPWR